MEKQPATRGKYLIILSGVLILLGLYLTSRYSFPLFHSLAEIFSIIIAYSLFIIAWNSRRFLDNHYLLFMGIAYFFIGALDMVHALAYKGMGVFQGYGQTNLPAQLWIAARYVQSLSLLIAPLFLHRKLKISLAFLGYALVTSLLLASIFYWNIFPECFVEGVGLTPFKKASEYIISLTLVASMILLSRNRKEFDKNVLQLLTVSLALTIGSELAFTFYTDAYGILNLVGHYLKILAFCFFYVALVETGLTKPYNLLFRHLKQSEETLTYQAQQLEEKVKEGTAALEAEFAACERAEEALVKANRLLRMISLSNQTLIHATDEQKLLRDVCEIAVGAGGYLLSWVGYAEQNEVKTVRPVAQAGYEGGFLKTAGFTWTDTEQGRSPTGVAIRTGKPSMVRNISLDPNFAPWRVEALKRGYASSIALPLISNRHTYGAFNIYAAEPNSFEQKDVDLLTELAGDLAYGITTLRMRAEQGRAEAALRESEERFRNLVENAPVGISISTLDGRNLVRNKAVAEMLGYDSPEEYLKLPVIETFYDPEDRRRLLEMVQKGLVRNFEARRKRKDGTTIWTSLTAIPQDTEFGKGLMTVTQDITETKQAEEENKQSLSRWQKAVEQTIQSMALISEVRDPYTAGHQRRVAELSIAIAREMGLPSYQTQGVRMAAFIHDIGKIHVPSEILSKPGKLTEPEFSLIKSHCEVGYDILKTIEFPWPIARIVLEHHERLNGSGYPSGITGDKVLLEAKVLAVADVVEAMSSHRPYRPALGVEKALEEIHNEQGILYDPDVAEACMKLFKEKSFRFEPE